MARKMGILGQKLGMTQVFAADGSRVPVTVVRAGPCVVVQKKDGGKDGYAALTLGLDDKPLRLTNRPERGVAKKAGVEPKRFLREVRLDDVSAYQPGQTIAVAEVLHAGDHVDVIGTSKGKGFQGVMKRHNFSGFRATHGTHEYFRHPGSIGCRLTPGRVHKGKRMPGHMGHARVTARNLVVLQVVPDENVVLLRGSVPGPTGGYVVVRGTKKPIRAAQPAAA
jgi:large subunit ribosomal protein L3